MATRYELIIEKLDHMPDQNRRICKASVCGCLGCAGAIGAKWITDRELAMYNSGEMQDVIDKSQERWQ